MTILGGMDYFWGPPVGAAALVWLNQEITDYTAVLAVRARQPSCWCCCSSSPAASSAGSRRFGWPRRLSGRAMLEVRDLRKSFAGFRRRLRRQPDRRDQADRRGHRPERRRQVDAVQPDHRSSAARQRHVCCSTAATSPARRRTGSAAWASGARSSAPTSSRKLTVFENVQAAFLVHHGRGRNFWSRSDGLLPRRDRGAARLDRARRPGATRSPAPELRQPEAARTRPRAGERPGGAAARRADRRHVGDRDARDDPAARSASPRERGLTLLFTEHDMEVVFSIAQKIAVLHQGRMIAEGAPGRSARRSRGAPRLSRHGLTHAMMSALLAIEDIAHRLRPEPRAVRHFARGRRPANASACWAATASARRRRCAR